MSEPVNAYLNDSLSVQEAAGGAAGSAAGGAAGGAAGRSECGSRRTQITSPPRAPLKTVLRRVFWFLTMSAINAIPHT